MTLVVPCGVKFLIHYVHKNFLPGLDCFVQFGHKIEGVLLRSFDPYRVNTHAGYFMFASWLQKYLCMASNPRSHSQSLRGSSHYMTSSGRMIFSPCSRNYRRPFQILVDRAKLENTKAMGTPWRPRGFGHYMTSTPFGYIVSLCSQSSSKGLRILVGWQNTKKQKLPFVASAFSFCGPTRIRTSVAGFGDQNSTTEL